MAFVKQFIELRKEEITSTLSRNFFKVIYVLIRRLLKKEISLGLNPKLYSY